MKYFFLLIFLFGCGKSAGHKNHVQKEEALESVFFGTFIPLNKDYVRHPAGIVKLSVIQDDFHVVVAVRDITTAVHQQSFHLAERCPNVFDDINQDGILDSFEVFKAAGNILIPLDGDLETQFAGLHTWPSGNYRYDQSVSYSKMLGDLQATDEDLFDDYTKLKTRELPLRKLVVLIFGVPARTSLPASVSARQGLTQQESLPIACATLESSGQIPAEPDLSIPETRSEPVPAPAPVPIPAPAPQMRPTISSRIRTTWSRIWCRLHGCSVTGTNSTF